MGVKTLVGSSPTIPTIFFNGRVAERLIAPVLKTGKHVTVFRGFKSHLFLQIFLELWASGLSHIFAKDAMI